MPTEQCVFQILYNYSMVYWAIPVNKNTPLWRNVDCARGGLSRPEYLSQGVIYMIDNNYVWGGEEEEIH